MWWKNRIAVILADITNDMIRWNKYFCIAIFIFLWCCASYPTDVFSYMRARLVFKDSSAAIPYTAVFVAHFTLRT